MTNLVNNRRIQFSPRFNIHLTQAPSEIKIAFNEALELFREDPHHPQLRNHPLKGKYAGSRSIDVTSDWRAVFKMSSLKTKEIITFHYFGTHEQLYGKI